MINTLERKPCIDIEGLEERLRKGLITKFASEGDLGIRLPFTEEEIETLLVGMNEVIQEIERNGGRLPRITSNTLNIYFY